MKKNFILLLIVSFLSLETIAQPGLRLKTRRVLHRTALVIFEAQNVLKNTKNYNGEFAVAVNHQRFAKAMFFRRNFLQSMYHSRMARLHAMNILKENKKTIPSDWEFNDEEKELAAGSPSEKDLKSEMRKTNSNMPAEDQEYVNTILKDIDVDEIADVSEEPKPHQE